MAIIKMNQDLAIKVTELLHASFTSLDNAARKQVELELQALQADTEGYFEALMAIIMPASPIDPQIQNSAAINLRKFIREKVEAGAITQATREVLASRIFSALTSPGLQAAVKASLGYALVPVLNLDNGDPNNSIISGLLPGIVNALKGNGDAVIGACKTIKSAFSGFSTNPLLFPLFQHAHDHLMAACKNTLALLCASSDPNAAKVNVEVLHELCSTLTSIVEHFEITDKEKLKQFKDQYELAELFVSVLNTNLQDPGFSQPYFFCITDDTLYSKMNQTKSQVLQAINLILEFLAENRKDFLEAEGKKTMTLIGVDMPDSPFTNCFFNFLEPLTQSLHVLASLPSFDDVVNLEHVSELVVEVFLLLQKLAKENKFSGFFNTYYRNLVVEICFIFMRASKSDLDTVTDSPEEFVHLSTDLCERQETEHFKTAACQFYEALCEYVDGAVSFSTHVCCELIEHALAQIPLNYLSGYAKIMGEPHIMAEIGLLGLSVVSYCIGRRKDLMALIEDLLMRRWETFRAVTSEIVQQRFCMLLHYFGEKLFAEDSGWFTSVIQLVMNYCTPEGSPSAKNIQAAMTINYFITDESISYKVEDIIPNIFGHMVQLIPIQTSVQFFDALQEIISANFPVVLENVIQLATSLQEKIASVVAECLQEETTKKKKTIFIIKSWNILRFISAHKALPNEKLLEIEQILLPIFEYIRIPKQIDFDDDILLFEVSLMRKCQRVTQAGWTLFSQLHLVQDKYEGTFLQLFPILNCYLCYGKEQFAAQPEHLKTIADMSAKCLSAVFKGKVNEAANSEAALIYQQILHSFPGLVDNLLEGIFSNTLIKLMSQITQNFFKTRLLGVLLSGFAYDAARSVSILSSSTTPQGDTFLTFSLRKIIENSLFFIHTYDRKGAALGLIKLILNAGHIPDIANNVGHLFQTLIAILSADENPQIQSSFMKLEKELKDLSNSTEDVSTMAAKASRLIQLNKQLNSEEIEANLALTTFLTPLNGVDEYEEFRNFVRILNSGGHLQGLVSNLNQIQVSQLTNIIKSKKVEIAGFDKSVSDVRRIVRPKKKQIS